MTENKSSNLSKDNKLTLDILYYIIVYNQSKSEDYQFNQTIWNQGSFNRLEQVCSTNILEKQERLYSDKELLIREASLLREKVQRMEYQNTVMIENLKNQEKKMNEKIEDIQKDKNFLIRQISDYKQKEIQNEHLIRRYEHDLKAQNEKRKPLLPKLEFQKKSFKKNDSLISKETKINQNQNQNQNISSKDEDHFINKITSKLKEVKPEKTFSTNDEILQELFKSLGEFKSMKSDQEFLKSELDYYQSLVNEQHKLLENFCKNE